MKSEFRIFCFPVACLIVAVSMALIISWSTLAAEKSGLTKEAILLQELLARKTFSPAGLDNLNSSDGTSIFYIPIKPTDAENLLKQFRTKTANTNYSPIIVQDIPTLKKLASEAVWRPVTFKVSLEDMAKRIAQDESISIQKAEEQAKITQQLWEIEDGNLQLNSSTEQIVSASESCNIDLWFQLKDKLKKPALNRYSGRPKVATHLSILGPQPDSFDEHEIEATLKASPISMGGGTSYDPKTDTTTEILQFATQKTEPVVVTAQMIKEYKEQMAELGPKELLLCFVPVQQSWQIPAFFRFGYFRKPSALINTAMQKRLHDKYGAEVAAISTDDLEVTLPQAPAASELESLSTELALYNRHFAGNDKDDFQRFLAKSTVWSFYW